MHKPYVAWPALDYSMKLLLWKGNSNSQSTPWKHYHTIGIVLWYFTFNPPTEHIYSWDSLRYSLDGIVALWVVQPPHPSVSLIPPGSHQCQRRLWFCLSKRGTLPVGCVACVAWCLLDVATALYFFPHSDRSGWQEANSCCRHKSQSQAARPWRRARSLQCHSGSTESAVQSAEKAADWNTWNKGEFLTKKM